MEDSFFGFDTSAPLDDDGGGRIAEPSEEEYDALNDETFGSAINGDWEEVHESLVRLTNHHNGDSNEEAAGACRLPASGDSAGMGLFDTNSSGSSSSAATPAHMGSHRSKNDIDSDLGFNLSNMKLDDVDITFDDSDSIVGHSGLGMDPNVWATIPAKSLIRNSSKTDLDKSSSMLYTDSLQQQQQEQQHTLYQQRFPKAGPGFVGEQRHVSKPPKICTLEDIERNIIMQQAMQKQQRKQCSPQEQQELLNMLKENPKSPTQAQQLQHQQQQQQQPPPPPPPLQQQPSLQQLQQQQLQSTKLQQTPLKGPPGFNQFHGPPRPLNNNSNNFVKNMAQHPLGNLMQQQHPAGNRMPPGFPMMPGYPPNLATHLHLQNHAQLRPHPLLTQHPLPPNFPHPHQRPLPNAHLPVALNNFAMHPNFNAMRAAAAAVGVHPVALVPPPPRPPLQPSAAPLAPPNSMYNMYNMRLIQEIRQNHPLLQNVARQQPPQQFAALPNALNMQMLHHQHQQQVQRHAGGGVMKQQTQHPRRLDGNGANGNLPPEEFDEYANLMSTRDKHWLIGIQLSQLNTDTPYIDDFYYTVYTERKAQMNGDVRQSKTHKDNQLNHPLTQPRGHAQLILVQLGNKNGTRSNGQHREHRNSESTGISSQDSVPKPSYVFTPLQFENSLGKLQYGSVTAPRKIIDADIMGSDGSTSGAAGVNTSRAGDSLLNLKSSSVGVAVALSSNIGSEISLTQRKLRHILIHIETLFRIVLKLEDLDNPNAIATIIMKKKKENERLLLLEQIENANKSSDEKAVEVNCSQQTLNPAMKNRFAYEIETKDALIAQLVAGLSHEKVVAMMNVRKGKVLLRRILPYLCHHDMRWSIWTGVFASLQNVVKKDRDDADGILYALYPELKKQMQSATFETLVKLATAIPLNDKKTNGVFCSKFGISAIVCLILQAETLHVAGDEATTTSLRDNWRQFLDQVATSLNRTIQNHTICAAIESDSIQPMMDHFARFKDLKLDSLLALITEAKQQIN